MAKLHAWAVAGVLLAVIGCKSHSKQSTAVVDQLPKPSFQGPALASASKVSAQPKAAPAPYRGPVASKGTARDWAPSVKARQWRYIVMHHSATPAGGAARFDKMHKGKGWDELGYHFVIGNGTDTGDGHIEVGPRWLKQKHGAHAKTPNNEYNERGIGICLVGNFDVDRPTPAQTQAANRLVAHLIKTYGISGSNIVGHGDTGRATDCPGRYMNVGAIRSTAVRLAGQADVPTPIRTASADLLQPLP